MRIIGTAWILCVVSDVLPTVPPQQTHAFACPHLVLLLSRAHGRKMIHPLFRLYLHMHLAFQIETETAAEGNTCIPSFTAGATRSTWLSGSFSHTPLLPFALHACTAMLSGISSVRKC